MSSSYSEGWSAPSCPLPPESPASSSNSASRPPYPPCPRHFPLKQCHWPPSPHLQRRPPPCRTFQRRRWSLDEKKNNVEKTLASGDFCCYLTRKVVEVQFVCNKNPPMGVLCLSVCFSWLISGGVAPTTGPISSPSLGSVKWKEISVVEKHNWNQIRAISVYYSC